MPVITAYETFDLRINDTTPLTKFTLIIVDCIESVCGEMHKRPDQHTNAQRDLLSIHLVSTVSHEIRYINMGISNVVILSPNFLVQN
jgi:hypothetical protein